MATKFDSAMEINILGSCRQKFSMVISMATGVSGTHDGGVVKVVVVDIVGGQGNREGSEEVVAQNNTTFFSFFWREGERVCSSQS